MQVPSPAPCYTISAFVRHDSLLDCAHAGSVHAHSMDADGCIHVYGHTRDKPRY